MFLGWWPNIITFGVPLTLRKIVSFLDAIIYRVDAELYDLVIKIANAEVLEQSAIAEVANRVYQLLALIMMFRLISVFITYVINPDDMIDKTKGFQNIIKKMIIALGLIIIVPWGFREARNLQTIVLQDGVIEYLVFGQTNDTGAANGSYFMYSVGKLFVTPYKCIDAECGFHDPSTSASNEEGNICNVNTWPDDVAKDLNIQYGGVTQCNGTDCIGKCGYGATKNPGYAKNLQRAITNSGGKYDVHALMVLGAHGDVETSSYYAEYRFPFIGTTLVGLFIGYMLVIMCIDVAVRSIKLAFYELMAPIPIISYIGPKSGKDTMLSKWFTQVLKTYGDLFIRIGGLQIAVFFITTLLGNNKLFKQDNIFVVLFLIIGALTFAKNLPNILKDLGVNLDTGGFNLKKKLNDDMLGSKQLKRVGAAGLGLAGGLAANAYRNISNKYKHGQEYKKAIQEYNARTGAHLSTKRTNKDDYNTFMAASQENRKYGWTRDRRNYAALQAYQSANDRAIAEGKSATEASIIAGEAAAKASKRYKKDHADEYGSNIVAGAISAATRAATTKDGKLFAGAREGIKGATDARDLRDKRQQAEYGFGDRVADSIRSVAGVDTVAKNRAKELRAEITGLQNKAYAHQQQVSNSLQQIIAQGCSQDDVDKWMIAGACPSTNPVVAAEFNRYKNAMNNSAKLQAEITKKEKALGLYEQEKK